MKTTLITILTIILSLLYFASNGQTLTVYGKSNIEGNDHSDKLITLKKDTTTIKVLTGEKSFSFNLELESQYTITFSKKEYITKTVLINTMFVPEERKKYKFEPYTFHTTIFPQPENETVTFNQPIGVIGFNKSLDDFDYKTNYTKTIKNKN